MMDVQQEKALEAVGVQWELTPSWEERFAQLVEFRRLHGSCSVPQRYNHIHLFWLLRTHIFP